jgi:hypothetical protein
VARVLAEQQPLAVGMPNSRKWPRTDVAALRQRRRLALHGLATDSASLGEAMHTGYRGLLHVGLTFTCVFDGRWDGSFQE